MRRTPVLVTLAAAAVAAGIAIPTALAASATPAPTPSVAGMSFQPWLRILVSLAAGAAFGVLVAIVLAIVDLYISGHGRKPLSSPLIDWPSAGVHLSLADLVFLAAVVIGAALTWRGTARRGA